MKSARTPEKLPGITDKVKYTLKITTRLRARFFVRDACPGGGGGVLNKVLYRKTPPQGPTPYRIIYHFGRKGTPFIYLLLKKGTPLKHLF